MTLLRYAFRRLLRLIGTPNCSHEHYIEHSRENNMPKKYTVLTSVKSVFSLSKCNVVTFLSQSKVDKYGDRIRWNPSRILSFMTVNGPYLTRFIWAVLWPYFTVWQTVENDRIRWENAVSDRLHPFTIRQNTAIIRLIWNGPNTMENGRLRPCMIDLGCFSIISESTSSANRNSIR